MLKGAAHWATTPIVPEGPVSKFNDTLTTPHLHQSPGMARLKGFGAGALEGLRGLTSPLQLAGMAGLGGSVIGALRAAGGAAGGLGEAASAMGRAGPAMETLGEVSPEFTPVGGEEMYNVGKGATEAPQLSPLQKAYQNIMTKRGGLQQ